MKNKWFNMRVSEEELALLKADSGKTGRKVSGLLMWLWKEWRSAQVNSAEQK